MTNIQRAINKQIGIVADFKVQARCNDSYAEKKRRLEEHAVGQLKLARAVIEAAAVLKASLEPRTPSGPQSDRLPGPVAMSHLFVAMATWADHVNGEEP